ncbi:uncharacterized protein kek5 [Eurosta solidaginis]|uniref:uncharacterized protein kek5 n=1 Tax=Eurosta solidaginis TaxID=178769 RepID=UPI0035306E29
MHTQIKTKSSTASSCYRHESSHYQRDQGSAQMSNRNSSSCGIKGKAHRPTNHTRTCSSALLLVFSQLLLLQLLCAYIAPTDGNPDWMQSCSMCHCNWNSGKKTADCRARSLTAIPNDLSNEMQVVDFSNNIIPELRREEFADANLPNLHKIFLRNCTIQELNRDALKGLTILIELDMSHNFIRKLHVGTFSGLEKLRNLVMNYNEIEVLDNYLFVDLPFLSRVEFKNNRLKQVEMHAFGQQPMLAAIYLEANSLSVLRKETFMNIPKLMHLSLAQNPWNCTCELQAFRDFALANRLYTPPTDCAQPAALRGKLWTDILSENFACQPRILGSVRSFVEVQSDNITLPCRVEGLPRPNVTWIYNRRAINPNDQRFRVLNSIEQHSLIGAAEPTQPITSELRIFNVRASDKGMYTCIAENRGGKAEAEFQLIVDGDFFGALEGMSGGIGASTTETQSNFLLVICLIVITILLLVMCVLLIACWWCRRSRSYQKDSTMMSENGLISTKMDKTNSSMLEGSVIMEMQKSLLTEVNPVEKPPRRTELENADGSDEGHEIKKTLLDESQFGNHPRDDETHSVALSDTTAPRVRHTYIDDTYGTSLPPDLLAFPARVPPTSPSMQSSHSNIPEQIIYGIRSPPLTSPVYAHMTPHGIYGTTIAAATPNGFMTLQHPKSRNLALIAAANNRQQQQHQQQIHAHLTAQHAHQQQQQQQQSPFVPAPVIYSPTAAVVMKQGYMTIPRKPRVPSWAPSTSTTQHSQLSEFQSPTSPNPSETGTATTAELQVEPVYDNLGLRTTAAGNSALNLHKMHPEVSSVSGASSSSTRYTMRDRPLPATPSLTSVASSTAAMQQQQQQQQVQQAQQQQQHSQQAQLQQQQEKVTPTVVEAVAGSTSKIYEPIHELVNNHHPTTNSDTEPLYGSARHHSGVTIVPSASNINGASSGVAVLNTSTGTNAFNGEPTKVAKIPPRPPPKPKKKISVTTTRGGQGSTSQLFDDEGEDGTEV